MLWLILVKFAINLGLAFWFGWDSRYPLGFMFFGFAMADMGSFWVARS